MQNECGERSRPFDSFFPWFHYFMGEKLWKILYPFPQNINELTASIKTSPLINRVVGENDISANVSASMES